MVSYGLMGFLCGLKQFLTCINGMLGAAASSFFFGPWKIIAGDLLIFHPEKGEKTIPTTFAFFLGGSSTYCDI